MLLKPDNKCEERVDIILLSEIIANFTYWQVIFSQVRHLKLLQCSAFL